MGVTAAASDVTKDLFPGNADRPLAIQIVKPPVQLLSLDVCQRDPFRSRAKTLPQLFHQPQPLTST